METTSLYGRLGSATVVSAAQYMAAMDDSMGVLSKHDIEQTTPKDVLAILYALKVEIVDL